MKKIRIVIQMELLMRNFKVENKRTKMLFKKEVKRIILKRLY
jgi:hypothetical protein